MTSGESFTAVPSKRITDVGGLVKPKPDSTAFGMMSRDSRGPFKDVSSKSQRHNFSPQRGVRPAAGAQRSAGCMCIANTLYHSTMPTRGGPGFGLGQDPDFSFRLIFVAGTLGLLTKRWASIGCLGPCASQFYSRLGPLTPQRGSCFAVA